MILTVGNTKGGVGKTTLALNIAIARAMAGRDVWLIDSDRQGTAETAILIRAQSEQAPSIACAKYADGPLLRSQVQQQARKFDDVIIDAGGRDSTALRAALTVSDVFLAPFLPRSYDVWALQDMAALIDEVRSMRDDLKVYAVLNRADPGASSDNKDAAEAVADIPQFEYLNTMIGNRKAFANEGGYGLSVLEGKGKRKDKQAIVELNALVSILF